MNRVSEIKKYFNHYGEIICQFWGLAYISYSYWVPFYCSFSEGGRNVSIGWHYPPFKQQGPGPSCSKGD